APPMIAARAGEPLAPNGAREQWLRGRLDHDADATPRVTPFADQDSALVRVFAASNVLIRRRPGAAAAAVGDLLDVLPLTRG
ncbi:MAG: molybdopterin molybdenumtransferase MoeA, partial [Caulobacteraceae bacterium]